MPNSEEQFRQLANSIPQLAWMADSKGEVYWYNERWFNYTGKTLAEMEGWGWQKVHHPDFIEDVVAQWQKCIQTGENLEYTFPLRSANGEYRWFLTRAYAIRDTEGKIVRWFGTNTDITAERRLHAITDGQKKALEMSMHSAPLKSILELLTRIMEENVNNGVRCSILLASEDKKYLVTAAAPSLPLEYTAAIDGIKIGDEMGSCGAAAFLQKSHFTSDIATDPNWKEFKDLALAHGLRACWSTPVFSPAGELLGTFILYYDKPTQPTSEEYEIVDFMTRTAGIVIGRAREASLQKMWEAELVKAHTVAESASKAKSEFLATMSHEIRTPLNAIIGIGHILARTSPLTDKQIHCINTLQSSSESLLMLINDLLDLSKFESENVHLESISFNLRELIINVMEMSRINANEKKITLTLNCDKNIDGKLIGDPHRLRQIVINLVGNAVKFTERGGVTVTVQTESETTDLAHIAIRVADTGIGIAADKLETIFNKFSQGENSTTRKYGGTGLGLTISKTLAELMGGTITVTSCKGIGSEFVLRLPLVKDNTNLSKRLVQMFTLSVKKVSNENAGPSPAQPCILIVEDYKPNLLVATSYIEMLGYRYDAAQNGEEAITKVKSGEYDALLMDVQMPGMDGIEATRAIREWEKEKNLRPVPIIGITAYALDGDREKCIAAGMDEYLSKPFSPEVLKEKITSLMHTNPVKNAARLQAAI